MAQITVDKKRCKRCGYCVAFCPTKVYEQETDGLPRVKNPEKCIACRMCEKRCPDFAIRVED